MSSAYSHPNPAIRIQQSTPTPGYQFTAGQPQQNQQQQLQFDNSNINTYGAQYWDQSLVGSNGQMVATQTLQTPGLTRSRSHQRNQSSSSIGSSIGSSGSASPFSQSHASGYTAFSNHHLPTPTQTPTQDTFLASGYPAYSQGPIDSTVQAHLAMNSAIEHSSNIDEDLPGMSHSARQSISSLGQEPSTPRTTAGDYYDDAQQHSYDVSIPQDVPKLNRTVSDAIADNAYMPQPPQIYTQMASRPSNSQQYL
ncbi:hypothetical protein EJ08DRAFT_620646, partial [Tothia fuscella]